jgi:hypothetical protein
VADTPYLFAGSLPAEWASDPSLNQGFWWATGVHGVGDGGYYTTVADIENHTSIYVMPQRDWTDEQAYFNFTAQYGLA